MIVMSDIFKTSSNSLAGEMFMVSGRWETYIQIDLALEGKCDSMALRSGIERTTKI